MQRTTGESFILNVPGLVNWDVRSAQGRLTIDQDGMLHVDQGSIGAVFAQLALASSGYYTLATTVGAETYSDPLPTQPAASGSSSGNSAENGGSIPASVKRYALMYDANGGEGVMIDVFSPYITASTVTVKENAYTREGNTFESFNTKRDGSGIRMLPGDTFIITEDTVLYAQWSKGGAAAPAVSGTADMGESVPAMAAQQTAEGGVEQQKGQTYSGKPAQATAMSAKAQIEAVNAPVREKAWLPWLAASPALGGALYLVLAVLKKRYC